MSFRLAILSFGSALVAACASTSSTPASGASASGADTVASGDLPPEAPLGADDLKRTWVRLSPPHANGDAVVSRTPDGFLALVVETTPTGGKSEGPRWHYLYRSTDGIAWQRVPFDLQTRDYAGNEAVAYGAGRYVFNFVFGVQTSTDLAQWSPASFVDGQPDFWTVWRIDRRFFALGAQHIWTSNDGLTWTPSSIPLVQGKAIAHGNGVFVVAGAISIRRSTDGLAWEDQTPSCATPGVKCVSPPGGGSETYSSAGNVVFLDGRFYLDRLTSSDGITWTPHDMPIANAAIGGYLFKYIADDSPYPNGELRVWRPGEPVQLLGVEEVSTPAVLAAGQGPATVTTPLPGGETCADHRCVVVNRELYLLR